MMDQKLRHLAHPPNTVEELRQQLQVARDEIPQDGIDHLISSMPRRVTFCIQARGDVTYY
ncbi:hypothetical protein BDFB_008755 [Asbolus verrucosus]|uniref:Uncharacterized protein n=1 Tax=Asbolus verrucosus TaxID=1661398 RepID=A0A482VF72_ASBVE|nr:hypothetical protein BDFB_008755 [Asbolus verrucosus]